MNKLIHSLRAPQLYLLCLVAASLSACAIATAPSSQVRLQQLKDAHVAFLDRHTRPAGMAAADVPWDQASFDAEVAKINQQFAAAESAESKAVPARKQFIRNSAELFQRDASFVRDNHSVSPAFAANRKNQLQQNYDLMLKSGTAH